MSFISIAKQLLSLLVVLFIFSVNSLVNIFLAIDLNIYTEKNDRIRIFKISYYYGIMNFDRNVIFKHTPTFLLYTF